MIKLHQFKRQWGIANPSPFCMKVETYLAYDGACVLGHRGSIAFERPQEETALHRRRGEGDPGLGFHHRLPQGELRKPARRRSVARAASRSASVAALMRREPAMARRASRWIDDRGWSVIKPAFFGALPPVLREAVPWLAQRRVKRMSCGCKAWAVTYPRRSIALASRISRRSPPA